MTQQEAMLRDKHRCSPLPARSQPPSRSAAEDCRKHPCPCMYSAAVSCDEEQSLTWRKPQLLMHNWYFYIQAYMLCFKIIARHSCVWL